MEERRERIIPLYDKGMSIKDIAKIEGVSMPTIANDIEQLISAVRTKMDTLISDEDKEAASESLEVIEAEVISEKPKKSMIKTAIASLQAIKGTVEFGSAVAALIQFVGPMLS